MNCKTLNCQGIGKLRKDGSRYFAGGYCNSCYQKRAREKDNRMAVYYKMINRCSNPNNEGYKDYGGRGIKVCERWLPINNGFKNFCMDMGQRPDKKTPSGKYKFSIDRVDNNAGYFKDNCKWSNQHEQNNNRRDTKIRTEDSYVKKELRFRGVSFRKYKYKNGKQYLNKKSHWCASIWIDGDHIRIYCDNREDAIMIRLGMEVSFLGDSMTV